MMWKSEIFEIIKSVEKLKLSKNNKKFIEIIQNPWGFDHSMPGEYHPASDKNEGETKWQREIYESEEYWYDLELPIGQNKSAESERWSSLRVDLVGEIGSRPVICEFKDTTHAANPFDAVLQLLAYYCMIKQNAEKLDLLSIHHTNNDIRNRSFKWVDLADNPILILRANGEYWNNWHKGTPKTRPPDRLSSCAKRMD